MKDTVLIDSIDKLINLCGANDENLRMIEKRLNVNIMTVNGELSIVGEEKDVKNAVMVINLLIKHAPRDLIKRPLVDLAIETIMSGSDADISEITQIFSYTAKGRPIRCKTYGQYNYVKAIEGKDIVFGIGPAGTGKTYLAVAEAVLAYKNKRVDKIILTRPAVEAGEKLGFLPGDLEAKVDPYLRPLYDALEEMLGSELYLRLMEKGNIEIAPLAYMRGRTLSDAFIILDESQNTTKEQMKMFLTRLGEGSKMVVNGDVTQIDLPSGVMSGLIDASKVLKDLEDISIITLTGRDIVRNDLVQKIVKAYEQHSSNN